MEQLNLTENVDTLFRPGEFHTEGGIIGKPVTQGNKTFLPVVSITMGYSGNANMKGRSRRQNHRFVHQYRSARLGAKLCTDAVIVIDGQTSPSCR